MKSSNLAEQIDHHVEEEEGSMFPKARYSGVDTLALGAVMAARKSELMSGAAVKPVEAPSPRSKAEKQPAKKKAAPASRKKRR